MVPGDSNNDISATATEESPLSHPTIASAEGQTKKKKKPRYSKAKKRELQQQKLLKEEEERKLKKSKKRKRTREKSNATNKAKSEPPKDEIDRILQCAEKSLSTNSIVVINKSEKSGEASQTPQIDNQNASNGNETNDTTEQRRLIVEIISGCDLSGHDSDIKSAKPEPLSLPSSSLTNMIFTKMVCTINVQPLLVLDLNGILCHRDRKPKRSTFLESLQADSRFHKGTSNTERNTITSWDLRQPIGNVANTGIIPRTDLLEFLHYLDKHFCLAVWTSAKSKTAKKLLNLLLSGDDGGGAMNTIQDKYDCKGIRSRLLFVWSQNQCTAVRSTNGSPDEIRTGLLSTDESTADAQVKKFDDDDDEHSFDGNLVFEKHLPKVWEAYPLWSASNTLLIDDSPEKCSVAVSNAIHPPPLHGRNPQGKSDQNSCFLSDQDNEDRQASFFRNLVSFWTDCPHRSQPPWDLIGEERTSVGDTNTLYNKFLQKHAKGYMGWREEKT